MDFAFNEDQEELRRYVRQWLEEKSSSETVRKLMGTADGHSAQLWSETAEMGWQAMAIPEEYGGAGFGFLELAVILEEQGRALFTGPFLSSTVLAAYALLLGGTEAQKQRLLPGIASGETIATVAASDEEGHLTVQPTATTAVRDGDTWVLSGTKRFVLDGHTADVLLVTADTGDGISIFIVEGSAVRAEVLPTMDETRKQADVVLAGVRVDEVDRFEIGAATVLPVLDRYASAALAIESVGAAQRCLDMSVEYAKDRKQFNRPIGSFQSIKHKCADMLVELEAAKSAAYYAAWAVGEDSDDAEEAASIAKAYCTDAFYHCAAENIQIHGGIGFTWEHDAHLYFKRAKSSQLMFGSPQHHRARLAALIGL
ncbi:MAG: acyl-CoA/acyl-ACP dehydrogenase [Acidimicrobiia bacterium]|nr:acyl-CoA/acyl-ACP dehydrogenase [Acidimicrobiia bacterium]